jgi:hypothetical protein
MRNLLVAICNINISVLLIEIFIVNLIYSLLEKFKDNKLALNHVFEILKTLVNLFWKIKGSSSLIITLESSAKRIGEETLFNTRG